MIEIINEGDIMRLKTNIIIACMAIMFLAASASALPGDGSGQMDETILKATGNTTIDQTAGQEEEQGMPGEPKDENESQDLKDAEQNKRMIEDRLRKNNTQGDDPNRMNGQDALKDNNEDSEKAGEIRDNRMKNGEALRERIEKKRQEMERNIDLDDTDMNRSIIRHHNRVRAAVHGLLEMENFTGNMGQEISSIARGFNNSINKTYQAEEKIQKRAGISRFFFGGDRDAADTIEREINQSRDRIRQLKQIREDCDCTEDVKEIMSEQIQEMEQEQSRLEDVAREERRNNGIFGWLLG